MVACQVLPPTLGRLIFAVPLFAILLALAGCSGDSTPPRDLLLNPRDFSDQTVTHSVQEIDDSLLDGAAVLVELTGPDFTLLESLVLFESDALAMKVLDEIKQDQLAQGVIAETKDGFDGNSGLMAESLRSQDASTLFFVEGRALVRITLSGENHAGKAWEMARMARKKSSN
ncbi:MAG: hypothetical protein CL902_12670 [Dehalococcoidia bacterium]|nr:hypothetical protein [Dehalococcoidia bacterium]